MKTAVHVRRLEDWMSDAALYELSEPVEWEDYETETTHRTKFVVVSAVVAPFTGPETLIFPADESGETHNMVDLAGSQRGTLSHYEALRAAGYEWGAR